MSQIKQQLTDINWIGIVKTTGDEWSAYTRKFTLAQTPENAVIRVDSYGVCGIYINGEFLETAMGRYMHRISCIECTSKLHTGENEIKLLLGSHIFQGAGAEIRERRGSWFSAVAAEIVIGCSERQKRIVTDAGWTCISDDGQTSPQEFSQITRAEYDRFWRSAALWHEPVQLDVPEAVESVAGEEYISYIRDFRREYALPDKADKTGQYITYDFGRLEVGYLELEYEAETDCRVRLLFDFSESVDNFEGKVECAEAEAFYKAVTKRLGIDIVLEKDQHKKTVIHRRACRYLRVCFLDDICPEKLNVRMRLSLKPSLQQGWFTCDDPVLTKAWEVGKYTLHVNKHQEYESCPRHEMKFFVGDGILDALVDYYAFGDPSLTESSFSLTEIYAANGTRPDMHEKNISLWDYPAWRIIMAYNHYRYFADREFVARYYEELLQCLKWMVERAGKNGLIYQYPLFRDVFYVTSESVEYNSSFDRLGEKPLLNAVYYKSLLCMSEFAEIMNDPQGKEWKQMADQLYDAINKTLWNDEIGAYIDLYDTSYIPQDGNAVAVMYGLADREKASRIFDTLKEKTWSPYGSAILSEVRNPEHTRGGYDAISLMMCAYEAQARFMNGNGDDALELIRRAWGTMLDKGAGTFWEFSPNNGTDRWPGTCHAWSSGCTYILSAYVLGIRPEQPGYETVRFEPYGGMDCFAGVVPTVKGLVAVSCRTVSGTKTFRIALPKGMKINPVLPQGAVLEMTEYEC